MILGISQTQAACTIWQTMASKSASCFRPIQIDNRAKVKKETKGRAIIRKLKGLEQYLLPKVH